MMRTTDSSTQNISPLAGKPLPLKLLVDVSALLAAYYNAKPDPDIVAQRAAFGTSGHRGSAFKTSFNEQHILAITQAICLYREYQNINGPLFLGIDTHALSEPAFETALAVLAGNGVEVMIAGNEKYTPTPVISHAILAYNRGRATSFADGIVITPSHNPPDSGGFKYNPPTGGPADDLVTHWIEQRANELLRHSLHGVKRMSFDRALNAATTHRYDYLNTYVNDLDQLIDMAVIRAADIRIGVDPLGGAGVHYWPAIADRFDLNLAVVNEAVDPTFRFMTVDWDGQIRMDPSSPYAMQSLIDLKDHFDVAIACDTDHDRHGIITPSVGLLPPNHYLLVAISYLFRHRPLWDQSMAVGKTIVSSEMIDLVTMQVNRKLYEVPVGFKWFVAGLLDGSLGFAGEESAGASFARLDGNVWTTDKDGIAPALLAAEITGRMGRDPGEFYRELTEQFGESFYTRVDAPATSAQKMLLANLTPRQLHVTELAGDRIDSILDTASGNDAPIGGLKVTTAHGWFAARPSGTEDIYKIYAESFRDTDHLQRIILEAQSIVNDALTASVPRGIPGAESAVEKPWAKILQPIN